MDHRNAPSPAATMQTQSITCPFCPGTGLDQDPIVIRENGYSGRKCPSCSLIYVSPRPVPSEIDEIYRQDHAHVSAVSQPSGISKRLHDRHTLRIIERRRGGGRLLEIGPGRGSFVSEARARG